jgi:hypothetical protein
MFYTVKTAGKFLLTILFALFILTDPTVLTQNLQFTNCISIISNSVLIMFWLFTLIWNIFKQLLVNVLTFLER